MKVITFGEIMLRLAPEGYLRFVQADKFNATFGGGEANVSVALANYGIESEFVTKLPKNEIGQKCLNSLREYGVKTDNIVRDNERLGIYFLEKGASQRPSKVIYDRASSSISKAVIEDFDWEEIFKGADWFHFTGITPALKGNLPEICKEACIKAKENGLKISCDLNYRKKLWTVDEAKKTMTKLMKYVDVLIANEEDSDKVFSIKAENTNITSAKLNKEGYKQVATKLMDTFGFEKVAITLRESISASQNDWSAMLYDGKEYYFSKKYPIHIVDRVGGGDSFASGLIYALLNQYEIKEALEFAVAASCLKQTIEGDFNVITVDEVKNLAEGDASGRVQR